MRLLPVLNVSRSLKNRVSITQSVELTAGVFVIPGTRYVTTFRINPSTPMDVKPRPGPRTGVSLSRDLLMMPAVDLPDRGWRYSSYCIGHAHARVLSRWILAVRIQVPQGSSQGFPMAMMAQPACSHLFTIHAPPEVQPHHH